MCTTRTVKDDVVCPSRKYILYCSGTIFYIHSKNLIGLAAIILDKIAYFQTMRSVIDAKLYARASRLGRAMRRASAASWLVEVGDCARHLQNH